ncbi:Protein of unknown function [Ruegeria intermedia]|uniref:DUF2933 domain-containing protein n=2 Tax=Ruegeria intermedia TaxID=996115 RepID=A0A1M4ZRM4_9RHOB|nr:Protein of unknown function [Ruegeria intermedia]
MPRFELSEMERNVTSHQQADTAGKPAQDTGGKLMKWGMMACCVVMFAPIGLYFLAGGGAGGVSESLGLIAPLLLCVGAHVFMHKAMGKSCHATEEKKVEERPEAEEAIPPVAVRQ